MRFIVSAGASRFVDVANEHMWRIVSLPLLTPAQQVYTQAHTHVHTHVIHMSYHMSYAWHTRVAYTDTHLHTHVALDVGEMAYRFTAVTHII